MGKLGQLKVWANGGAWAKYYSTMNDHIMYPYMGISIMMYLDGSLIC